jgi:uncharacterized membrane protein
MAQRDSSSDPLSTNPNPGSSPTSTVQQVKDQAKSLAHDAKEEVSNVAGQARDQVQGLVSQQKTRVADQLGSLAGALRDTGNQLGQKLGDKQSNLLDLGGYAGKAADQVDRFSSYLRDRDLGEVVRDAETFARRRPELFLGGTFIAGLLLARFLKASGDAESLETGAVRAGQGYPRTGGTSLRTGTGYAGTSYTGTGAASGTYERTGDSAYQAPRPYTPPVGG